MPLGTQTYNSILNFNEQIQLAKTEVEMENAALFNERTRGAITLATVPNSGDLAERHFFKKFANLVGRRAIGTAQTGGVGSLGQFAQNAPKIASGTVPVDISPEFYTRMKISPQRAPIVLGEQMAAASAVDKLQAVFASLRGAFLIGNEAADNTGTGTLRNQGGHGSGKVWYHTKATRPATKGATVEGDELGIDGFNKALALYGDNSGRIVCWICHSAVWRAYLGKNVASATGIAPTQPLFNIANVGLQYDLEGRPVIISDNANLVDTHATNANEYYTYGLTAGAVEVQDGGDMQMGVQTDVKTNQNIQELIRFTWSFNPFILGYSFKGTTGTAAITDANLKLADNWEVASSTVQDTAGIGIVSYVKGL